MMPCPFCGEKPDSAYVDRVNDRAYVQCIGCLAIGPPVLAGFDETDEDLDDDALEQMAVDRWNKRT